MPQNQTVLIPDSVILLLRIRLMERRGQTLVPFYRLAVLDEIVLVRVCGIDPERTMLLADVVVIRCADGIGAASGSDLRLDPAELDLGPHVQRCLQIAFAVRILDAVAAAHQAEIVDLIGAPFRILRVGGIIQIGQTQIVTQLMADDSRAVEIGIVSELCDTDVIRHAHTVQLRHLGIL